MNLLESGELQAKLAHRARVILRHLDLFRKVKAFSSEAGSHAIGRIFVINLDRKPKRWHSVRRELGRFRSNENQPLTSLTRRFCAIDGRYLPEALPPDTLIPTFTLAEQLTVHPDPLLTIDDSARERHISMTNPEIAIALSHIEVWKLIAGGDVEFTMVLEDDVMMRPGFARKLNEQWKALQAEKAELVYLSYRDVSGVKRADSKSIHHQETPGLWEASAYILSRSAARKLLNALPANGPIDLWMNFQFGDLRTFTTSTQLIEQRLAEPSTNSYSVLPVLSQVGSVTREKVLVHKGKQMRGPVIAVGSADTGLTSLATALSTLGYSVASDLASLPPAEIARLRNRTVGSAFDAYVNVGALDEVLLGRVMSNKNARLIITDERPNPSGIPSHRILHLPHSTADKWEDLSRFFGMDYPSFPYPTDSDLGQRELKEATDTDVSMRHTDLEWDRSPWIMPVSNLPGGLSLRTTQLPKRVTMEWHKGDSLLPTIWVKREDTFPSNMAFFQPANVEVDEMIELTLKAQESLVRD